MELSFYIEDAKQSFVARTDKTKRSLAARGSLPLYKVLLDKMKQTGAVLERVDIQSDKSKLFPMLEKSGLCMTVIAFISL